MYKFTQFGTNIVPEKEPSFAERTQEKLQSILIDSSRLEHKVKTYQHLITSLLSNLRGCEDPKAHRSYLLTIRELKNSSGDIYNFLDGWVE